MIFTHVKRSNKSDVFTHLSYALNVTLTELSGDTVPTDLKKAIYIKGGKIHSTDETNRLYYFLCVTGTSLNF